MTDKQDYTIDEKVLPQALEAFNAGKESFEGFCAAAKILYRVEPEIFKAAFAKQRIGAARDAGFVALQKQAAGKTVTKPILALLELGAKFVTDHTIHEVKKGEEIVVAGYTPKVSFVVELIPGVDGKPAKGAIQVVLGAIRTRASKGGTKSPNSRISAFVAWDKTGSKKGDKFKVVKVKDSNGKLSGYKVDGRIVKKGGLTDYLVKMYPNSATVQKLRDYGQVN